MYLYFPVNQFVNQGGSTKYGIVPCDKSRKHLYVAAIITFVSSASRRAPNPFDQSITDPTIPVHPRLEAYNVLRHVRKRRGGKGRWTNIQTASGGREAQSADMPVSKKSNDEMERTWRSGTAHYCLWDLFVLVARGRIYHVCSPL